jgi:GNAT superfamily N-acetyltransferase
MTGTLTFRPIEPSDEAFLYQVYASTRTEELAPVAWTNAEKDVFLRQQFSAQHRHYQEHYSDTDFLIILLDAVPIGRLYVTRWKDEMRVVDIALLPEHRNSGIGTGILRDLMARAAAAGKPVRIHVEKFNPALRLYERLGFVAIEDKGVYLFLEWSAQRQVKTAS